MSTPVPLPLFPSPAKESTAETSGKALAATQKTPTVRKNSEESRTPAQEGKKPYPPMLAQYREYKQRFADHILLFQVGDFYEVFFEDAVTVARTIHLTLTSRDKNSDEPIPMCGVPVSAIDTYLQKLLQAGLSAVVVSQEPGATPTKQGVPRFVDRIVTPGIRLFESRSEEQSFIAGVMPFDRGFSLCWTTVQSGVIFLKELPTIEALLFEVKKIEPKEVIFPSSVKGQSIDGRVSWVKAIQTSTNAVGRFRTESFEIEKQCGGLQGFSTLQAGTKAGVKLLFSYIDEVTVGRGEILREIKVPDEDEYLLIDARTRQNLELFADAKGFHDRFSLFAFLNQASSPLGERLLAEWIKAPARKKEVIDERHNAVAELLNNAPLRVELKTLLASVPDLERIAARLQVLAVTPLELAALRNVLRALPELQKKLSTFASPLFSILSRSLTAPPELVDHLEVTLEEEPSGVFTEGKVIKDGFDSNLDEVRALRYAGREWVQALELEERTRTGISSLKLRYTNAFGFFIEITNSNLGKVPAEYRRKQTTVNGERFTTDALQAKESDIRSAEAREIQYQKEIFEVLRKKLLSSVEVIRAVARELSLLDALVALATVAEAHGLVRPIITSSKRLFINDGAHPVLLAELGTSCIRNSIDFSNSSQAFILTGPNMGGKSTYLRQIALIVIMAQLGSFVPAASAEIGIVDRLFARIGAADNLAEGESTFMVEMREAAFITATATESSLVFIDELGRGTATADGMSIAQAVFEHLVTVIQARSVLATHFHELTSLERFTPFVKNISVRVVEHEGVVSFPHEVKDGAGSASYGIEVAKLAGLPESIIDRSEELLLQHLSTPSVGITETRLPKKDPQIEKDRKKLAALKSFLDGVSIDATTPLAALQILAQCKEKIS